MLDMKRKALFAYTVALNSGLWLVLAGVMVFATR